MVEGGGVCVRRDSGERGTWLEMGRQLGEEWDPRGLGCSIHPSARLSRCVPGMMIYVGECGQMMIYVGECGRMIIYVGECGQMMI